mmetsp:Transcript_19737/g.46123  ORF Transcript_19737/g.46123 Transcript_19737/m.46123 type:complete len:261 (-) Transcript_19737:230-1012(-)
MSYRSDLSAISFRTLLGSSSSCFSFSLAGRLSSWIASMPTCTPPCLLALVLSTLPNISSGWFSSFHCRLQKGVMENSPDSPSFGVSSRTTRSLVRVGTLSLTPWVRPRASSWFNRRSNQTSMALSSREAAPWACSERIVIRLVPSSIEARVGMGKTWDWMGMSLRNRWVSKLNPFRSVWKTPRFWISGWVNRANHSSLLLCRLVSYTKSIAMPPRVPFAPFGSFRSTTVRFQCLVSTTAPPFWMSCPYSVYSPSLSGKKR